MALCWQNLIVLMIKLERLSVWFIRQGHLLCLLEQDKSILIWESLTLRTFFTNYLLNYFNEKWKICESKDQKKCFCASLREVYLGEVIKKTTTKVYFLGSFLNKNIFGFLYSVRMLCGTPNAPRVWDTRIQLVANTLWWNWYNNVLQLFYFMLWEQVFLLIFIYIYKFDITRRSQQKWTILLFATLTKYNFMFRWFRFRCSLVLMHI